eukprot:gnl/MRDRNA2_/MRDRNA2_87471_c0_seq1.p1 gnl/MRDRNA2_/MRDRNA2_87471_c0~~gnl/MRDRNA2_/MRDRNA2_87471_c0_seq1.p1  ORF type:complete len:146 (+),score=44.43 gnl/MRDRNA2_/MRDRNA2_87471_c0_seq1:93-530(+)
MAGNGQQALFDDAQSFLKNAIMEARRLERDIAKNDEARRLEIEGLRKELESERFERREALTKLQYEFEEFVHRKIDKVLQEVEEMRRMERGDDQSQQQQINNLEAELNHLMDYLVKIQLSWGRLVSNCLTDEGRKIRSGAATADA